MAAKKGFRPKAAGKKTAAKPAAAKQAKQPRGKSKEPEGLKAYRENRANRAGKQK